MGALNRYSIEEFIKQSEQKDKGEGFFELETPRLLEVNLDGQVWAKAGSMVAYHGEIKFVREGILEHGLGTAFKKAFTGEGASLMKANGKGKLYLSDSGKKIIILNLQNESIYINGNDLLAFEPSIKSEIKLMKKIAGMMAGGLFNVRCEGTGMIAFTAHYEPLTLRVSPGNPMITDPNATVAWSKKSSWYHPNLMVPRTFFGFLAFTIYYLLNVTKSTLTGSLSLALRSRLICPR